MVTYLYCDSQAGKEKFITVWSIKIYHDLSYHLLLLNIMLKNKNQNQGIIPIFPNLCRLQKNSWSLSNLSNVMKQYLYYYSISPCSVIEGQRIKIYFSFSNSFRHCNSGIVLNCCSLILRETQNLCNTPIT